MLSCLSSSTSKHGYVISAKLKTFHGKFSSHFAFVFFLTQPTGTKLKQHRDTSLDKTHSDHISTCYERINLHWRADL